MYRNKKLIGLVICIVVLGFSILAMTISATINLDTDEKIVEIETKKNEQTRLAKVVATFELTQNALESKTTKNSKEEQSKINQNLVPNNEEQKTTTGSYVTISIDCKTILNNMNDLDLKYHTYVPDDGIILSKKKVKINEGDTVYDVTVRVAKINRFQISAASDGYISSINNLSEKIFNGSGGWIYRLNGMTVGKGTKEQKLSNNDEIEWKYTCYNGDLN